MREQKESVRKQRSGEVVQTVERDPVGIQIHGEPGDS